MNFININKVNLEQTNDGKLAIATAGLVTMSIIYDLVKEKKYDEILHHIDILKCSAECLSRIIDVELKESKNNTTKLEKEDLVNLVSGIKPYYDAMNIELIAKSGTWNGSQDTWNWNKYKLKEYTEEQLINIYKLCKESWKK